MVLALIILGGLLQLVGLGVTLRGARRAWREFRPAERVFERQLARMRQLLLAAEDWTRKVLRLRRRPQVVRVGQTITEVSVAHEVRASMAYRPLSPDLELDQAIAELDGRTQAIMARVHEVRDELADRLKEVEGGQQRTEQLVVSEVDRLSQQDKHVATGGIQQVIVGLVAAIAGVVLQTIGSLLPLL